MSPMSIWSWSLFVHHCFNFRLFGRPKGPSHSWCSVGFQQPSPPLAGASHDAHMVRLGLAVLTRHGRRAPGWPLSSPSCPGLKPPPLASPRQRSLLKNVTLEKVTLQCHLLENLSLQRQFLENFAPILKNVSLAQIQQFSMSVMPMNHSS